MRIRAAIVALTTALGGVSALPLLHSATDKVALAGTASVVVDEAPMSRTRATTIALSASIHRIDAAPANDAGRHRVALIIGIARSAGAGTIGGAVVDALTVRRALLDYGFPPQGIEMLIDAQATRPAILAALRSLAARSSNDGTAVFAIASHSTAQSIRTYESARVSKFEIADALRKVRGRLWSLFAICHSGAYDLPGVSGPGRVATFSSSASDVTWDTPHGSDFVEAMVDKAMIHGTAPHSVESAFSYARAMVDESEFMDDQIRGDLVLGPVTWINHPSTYASHDSRTSEPNPTEPPNGSKLDDVIKDVRTG